jgi:putative DNA primase/helicase
MMSDSPAADRVLRMLHGVKRSGAGWVANCPAHDDRAPSLSISVGNDGRVLLCCHAGCPTAQIVEALGLTMRDLMPSDDATATTAAATKRKPRAFATASEAVAELERRHGPRAAMWRYDNAEGNPVGIVVRWDVDGGGKTIRPVSRNGSGWIIGGMPTPRPLYKLLTIATADRVYVAEGEKSADALMRLGLVATTSPHGSKSASGADWSPLRGRDVVVMPDNDDAGERYAEDVVELALKAGARSVRIVHLVDRWEDLPKGGDAADLIGDDADLGAIRAAIEKLVNDADAASTASASPRQAPRLIRMSDVEPIEIRWLWPGRIPMGRLTLLVGRPGDGKSFLTAHLAANVSRGRSWADGSPCPRGSVVLCSAEDDPADTIAPRLIAHDADRERVHLLAGVMTRDDDGEEVERVFTLADLPALRQTLEQLADCKLIVVDPVGSYLGGKADAHRDNEVRAVLAPVCHLAAQHGAAVVVVAHTRKAVAPNADDMVMGSRAFTGLARSVLHLMLDPDDEDKRRRLLLPGKSNLAERPPGLAFDIGPGENEGRPCVRWLEGEVTITADEAVNREPQHGDGKRTECDEAADWLREALAGGPMPAKEIRELAKESEGIATRTLDRAKKSAGIEAFRPENPGPWYWRLPGAGAHCHHDPKGEIGGNVAICSGASARADFDAESGGTLPHCQTPGSWQCAPDDSEDWAGRAGETDGGDYAPAPEPTDHVRVRI